MKTPSSRLPLACFLALVVNYGSTPAFAAEPKIGERLERRGDEIVVCGQLYHTTTPVVLWTDPGGYDAYRVERRFAPLDKADWEASKGQALRTPNRFGLRRPAALTPEQLERVRGGGWDLPLLQTVVDQFVIHFDARGTSRGCFEVLHDLRGLSVHFLLDLDGTVYQTLDLKERAWDATKANTRSVGIEIANIGAFPVDRAELLDRWYQRDTDGRMKLANPDLDSLGSSRASRSAPSATQPVTGTIQGQTLRQYDLTAQQYDALIRLTATLCTLLPKIRCDYPRDATGALIPQKLPDPDFERYQGILGHYHVQTNKVDPGPAFQWNKLVDEARILLHHEAKGP